MNASHFAPPSGKRIGTVNLPLLAAVLAAMQEEESRYVRTAVLTAVSIAVAILSVVVSSLTYYRTTDRKHRHR
jgi:hypothetical protein